MNRRSRKPVDAIDIAIMICALVCLVLLGLAIAHA